MLFEGSYLLEKIGIFPSHVDTHQLRRRYRLLVKAHTTFRGIKFMVRREKEEKKTGPIFDQAPGGGWRGRRYRASR